MKVLKSLNYKRVTKILFASLITAPMILTADMDRCVSCHGVDFEKKALGVSKIVKDMSELEIKEALDGYKRGEGGSMKALMIKEVNLGVDTDVMSADVYSESRTPGFEEPSDEFIFQKRLSVRTLHKLRNNIKKADAKRDMPKIISQIKSAAFTMYTYDDLLKQKVDFKKIKHNKIKLKMKDILEKVSKVKTCVDHSFSDKGIVKCRVEFLNLAGSLTRDQEKKIKNKQRKSKPPIYTGPYSVDMSKYLK
ncbi:MAG: hypothetical protein U9R39_06815 [Campylobacterota bacterium]|nr:hypothetical protein [Campylobacterota bacterium]